MLETAIVAVLAAMGILLLCFCAAAAALMPAGGRGWCVLFADGSKETGRQVRGWRLLQRLGLCRLPVIVVDCGLSEAQRFEILYAQRGTDVRCLTPEQWKELREREERESGA